MLSLPDIEDEDLAAYLYEELELCGYSEEYIGELWDGNDL